MAAQVTQVVRRPKRTWVDEHGRELDPGADIWCRYNGGPADCDYHAVRPAAMGSHQGYKHALVAGEPTNVPVVHIPDAPAVEDAAQDAVTTTSNAISDVGVLVGRMGAEIRSLRSEVASLRSALAAIRGALGSADGLTLERLGR